MSAFIKYLNESLFFPVRRKKLVELLSPYLQDVREVLDLGASDGRLAYELSKVVDANFAGIDTHIQAKTFISIKKYDGRHIPFPDNHFDCVMIIDVIHHDTDPLAVLQEARRVSKKYILIKDHYWKTKLDFWLLKIGDWIGNKPYSITLPYNYLRINEWENLIQKLDLKVVKTDKFRYGGLDPLKHIIYFFEKH